MSEVDAPYRTTAKPKRTRIHHLREMKERGERWPMLTAYDHYSAQIFDEAGIPVLLVGDSAGNNVYGYDNTIPVTVDELMPLVRAVVRGAASALVVADLPFGSYQVSPEQALTTAIRFMKEAGAHAVKLEGGARFAPHVEAMVAAGHPGDGAPRLHPAVGARAGRVPHPGPRRRGRAAHRGRARHAGGGGVRRGAGDGARGRRQARDGRARDPDDRHRRGPGHRRPGAGVVGHGGHEPRSQAELRQAVRRLGEILLGAARAYADEVRAGSYPDAEHSYT